jgi:hypothetical protein
MKLVSLIGRLCALREPPQEISNPLILKYLKPSPGNFKLTYLEQEITIRSGESWRPNRKPPFAGSSPR